MIAPDSFAFNNKYNFVITEKDLTPNSQAAVTIRCGETTILVTANFSKADVDNHSIYHNHSLGLKVNYIKKMYAARKIPGGFNKREGKPTDQEILIARVIDRSIRPILKNEALPYEELQVVVTLLSYDAMVHNVDCLAINAAYAALSTLGLMRQPVGAVRITYTFEGEYLINASKNIQKQAHFNLIVSCSASEVFMLEMESYSKQVEQDSLVQALHYSQQYVESEILPGIKLFDQPYSKDVFSPRVVEHMQKVKNLVYARESDLQDVFMNQESIDHMIDKICAESIFSSPFLLDRKDVEVYVDQLLKKITKRKILNEGHLRFDGRGLDELRDIRVEMSVLPASHGSAIFKRGTTHVLSVLTIGGEKDFLILDDIEFINPRPDFILHYNFPPYISGEVGNIGASKRREIGHGALASKALITTLNKPFDNTVRIVSEVLSVDGSSSMAAVCSASLALQNAGISISSLTAGVAMGALYSEDNDKYAILTDITKREDSVGDLDFKIAGNKKGITAIQLDVKHHGISLFAANEILSRGMYAISHILDQMEKAADSSVISTKLPIQHMMKVDLKDIKFIIGKAGSNIKRIIGASNSLIDINDKEGEIKIVSENQEDLDKAVEMIKQSFVDPFEVKINEVYQGKIVKILPIGLFINLGPRTDGFLKMQGLNFHPKEGLTLTVKVISINKGKIQLALES